MTSAVELTLIAPEWARSLPPTRYAEPEITVARLYWETAPASDFDSLVKLVPDESLNSPRRSVVPLLDFCRVRNEALARLDAVVNPNLGDATDMIFEHAVPVQQGRGKPSFTDLLILTPVAVVAVEAKYTEPEYESVKSWLGEGQPNRHDVLQGWLNLLANALGRPIAEAEVQNLPYQLIHRAASACHIERSERAMIYLVFESAAPHYATHIDALATILRNCVSLSVVSCPVVKSKAYEELEQRWDAGERRMAPTVRSALMAAPLFTFGRLNNETPSRRSA